MHALVVMMILAANVANAEPQVEKTWHFDAEWNSSLALFGGVGGSVAVKPPTATQLRFGLGILELTLPEFGLGAANAGQGWSVNDKGVIVGGQYYFREKRGGFYAGLDLVIQQRTFTKSGVPGSSSVLQYVAAGAVGYEWFPFDSLGLYVAPNFTFAVRFAEAGEPKLGDATFDEGRVLPLPGVNVGWEF